MAWEDAFFKCGSAFVKKTRLGDNESYYTKLVDWLLSTGYVSKRDLDKDGVAFIELSVKDPLPEGKSIHIVDDRFWEGEALAGSIKRKLEKLVCHFGNAWKHAKPVDEFKAVAGTCVLDNLEYNGKIYTSLGSAFRQAALLFKYRWGGGYRISNRSSIGDCFVLDARSLSDEQRLEVKDILLPILKNIREEIIKEHSGMSVRGLRPSEMWGCHAPLSSPL